MTITKPWASCIARCDVRCWIAAIKTLVFYNSIDQRRQPLSLIVSYIMEWDHHLFRKPYSISWLEKIIASNQRSTKPICLPRCYMWPSIGRLSLECLYRTLLVIYLTLITENVSYAGGIWLILLGKYTLQVNWQLSISQGANALKDCFCEFPRDIVIRQYMGKLTHLHRPPMCCILSERWNVEQKKTLEANVITRILLEKA